MEVLGAPEFTSAAGGIVLLRPTATWKERIGIAIMRVVV